MVLSAVDATKALRDRSKPISDRTSLARDIVDGVVTVYLPRKSLVVLEWILSGIASDANTRTMSSAWKLLNIVWNQVDIESRRRALSGHQIAEYVAITLEDKESPLNESAIEEISIFLSFVIRDDSDPVPSTMEASRLVSAYLTSDRGCAKLSEVVWRLVRSRKLIFSDSCEIKDILQEPNDEARAKYLTDFLSSKERSVTPLREPNQASEVLSCVIKSNINVEDRFKALIDAYPSDTLHLLDVLQGCKPLPPLQPVLSAQLKIGHPDWDIFGQLLKLDPKIVLDDSEAICKLLDQSFNANFVEELLQRAVQFRRLNTLLPLWRTSWLDHSKVVSDALFRATATLSTKQVADLIGEHPSIAIVLVRSMKYETAAEPTLAMLLEKLLLSNSTWSLRGAILDVLPSAAHKVDIQQWLDEDCQLNLSKDKANCLLRLRELVEFDLRLILPYSIHTGSLERFFRLFEYFGSIAEIRELCNTAGALRSPYLIPESVFECPRVLGSLVEELLSGHHWGALETIPSVALAHAEKLSQVLTSAWSNGALKLCASILKFAPKVGKSLSAKQLVGVAMSIEESNAALLKTATQLWLSTEERKHELARALPSNSGGKWQPILLRALSGNYDEAVHYALTQPNSLPAVEILSVVPAVPDVLDAATKLALSQPSEAAYALVCRHLQPHWKLVLAYHIWTECEFGSVFREYFLAANADVLWLAAAECLNGRHYIAFKDLSELFPQAESRFAKLITIACVQELDSLKHTRSDTIDLDFFILIEEILRERQWLIAQPGLELILELICLSPTELESEWMVESLALSRVLLFQRHRLQGRMNLVVGGMSGLLKRLNSPAGATQYVRLMNNLCNPSHQSLHRQTNSKGNTSTLTSAVAQSRRLVAKHASTLLLNHVTFALSAKGAGPSVRLALQPAAFALFDVLGSDALRGITVLTDGPSRAYMRRLYEDYKAYGKWKAD